MFCSLIFFSYVISVTPREHDYKDLLRLKSLLHAGQRPVVVCEGCLGADHANQPLAADTACRTWRKLSLEEKHRPVDFFMGQDEGFVLPDLATID